MGTSVRKMYDAELLQLDTMLARMGHAAGGCPQGSYPVSYTHLTLPTNSLV